MRSWASRTFGIAVFACSAGCARDFGDSDAVPDGGADASIEPAEPAAPEPALRPVLGPCPKGWHEVADADDPELVTCDPWPEGGPVDCAAVDEAHFPGEPGCRRVGTPCPVGDFPEDLPVGAVVVYVRAGAVGGDGSKGAPFGTIAGAIEAAPDGAILALAKGTFDEVVILRDPLVLRGACVAETIIASSAPATNAATLRLIADGARVENLQVSGERIGVEFGLDGTDVILDSVVVREAVTVGVISFGRGRLTARDLVVEGTRPDADGDFGFALSLAVRAQAVLERAAFVGNSAVCIGMSGVGTELTASDLAVVDTHPWVRGDDAGTGLQVTDGARAEIERAAFVRNHNAAMYASGAQAQIVARDVVVRDTLVPAAAFQGIGLQMVDGAIADVRRVTIDGSHAFGLSVADGASLVAEDLVVRDTRTPDGRAALGLDQHDGARVELHRAVFARAQGVGIAVEEVSTELVAQDLVVRDTQVREADSEFGDGMQVRGGATVDLERVLLERNVSIGLLVGEADTVLVARDLVARGTLGRGTDGDGGDGLGVYVGGRIEVTRAVVESNRRYGVLVLDPGTTASFEDLRIEGTLPTECSETGACPEYGTAMATIAGALVDVTRFRFADNVLCGVQLAGGEIDLHDGVVSGNAIGANVATLGFDLERIRDRVLYVENGTALDTAELPAPESLSGFRD